MNLLSRADAPHQRLPMLDKVPEVTLFFWIIKIMATTVGETAADFLNFDLHFGLNATALLIGTLLAAFLLMQLRARRYVPWLYWLVVVLISIVGTLITDGLVDNFGVPLATTTIAFGLALLATFATWYASEKTLSIHAIFTTPRELFYWAAILFTFALGTAAGDLAAEGMQLGYANSTLMFGALIALVTIAWHVFRANAVLTFWLAYVLTRPLGASFGDFLSQATADGGLGLGTVLTSAIFLASIAGLVIYLSASRRDVQRAVPDNAA
ncbi:hypothetical protein [Accumulibacter sp.]|uniref:COG4705 family protein n=1 Tax=Accumulibacter sp. TaxID=2053492 RepID=UPI00261A6948|nr:hypothetical protein [Accumulibacter sp.]